jgi:hypothetical protein
VVPTRRCNELELDCVDRAKTLGDALPAVLCSDLWRQLGSRTARGYRFFVLWISLFRTIDI